PANQLIVATSLEVECLQELGRSTDAAKLIESVLKNPPLSLDDLSRIELYSQLAQCWHSARDFPAERDAIQQALQWRQTADRYQRSADQSALQARLAAALQALGDDTAADEKWADSAKSYRRLLGQMSAVASQPDANPEAQFSEIQCLQGLQDVDLHLSDW